MMRALKAVGITLVALFILVVGAAALGGYWAYSKAQVRTMPKIQMETVESYATNIANALIKKRTLEIPPEILSNLVSQQMGSPIACVVTAQNELKLWLRKAVPLVGEADICLTMDQEYFDRESGELAMNIRSIHVGELEVPDFLKTNVMKSVVEVPDIRVHISSRKLSLVLDKFTVDIMGVTLEIGVDSVEFLNGKLYFGLYANLDF